MPSEVVLVQGLTIGVSSAAQTELSPSPEPVLQMLDCVGRELSYQGGQATENDVTTFCSTAKEFRLGLEDSGNFTISGHWVQGNAAIAVLRTAAADKLARLFVVEFENGDQFRFLAYVAQRSWTAAVDGVVTGVWNLRLTGAVQEIVAT